MRRTITTLTRVSNGITTNVEATAQEEPGRVVLYVAAVRHRVNVQGVQRGSWQTEHDTYEDAVVNLDEGVLNLIGIGYQLVMRAETG